MASTKSTVNLGSRASLFLVNQNLVKRERVLFIDLGSHYGGVETYLDGLAGILGPSIEGYSGLFPAKANLAVASARDYRRSLPLLGSKWLKGLRFLLACFIVPYLLFASGSARYN